MNSDRLTENSSIRQFSVNTTILLTRYLNVSLVSPADNYVSNKSPVDFSFNISSINNIARCSLFLDGSTRKSLTTVQWNSLNTFNDVVISNGDWNWSVQCTDEVNSTHTSVSFKLTMATPTESEVPVDVVENEATPVAVANETVNETQNATITEEESADFSGALVEFFRGKLALIISVLFIIAVVGFVVLSKGMREKLGEWFEALRFKRNFGQPDEEEAAAYKRLEGYIKNFEARGFSEAKIYKHLQIYGWKKEDIDCVFDHIKEIERKEIERNQPH